MPFCRNLQCQFPLKNELGYVSITENSHPVQYPVCSKCEEKLSGLDRTEWILTFSPKGFIINKSSSPWSVVKSNDVPLTVVRLLQELKNESKERLLQDLRNEFKDGTKRKSTLLWDESPSTLKRNKIQIIQHPNGQCVFCKRWSPHAHRNCQCQVANTALTYTF